jgi:serine/threonine-protein kinase
LLQRADGSEEAQVLLPAAQGGWVCDWSRDGKYLLYELVKPATSQDLWYLERAEGGSGWEPHMFLQTPFNERAAQLSPDGRHVAYVSDASGQYEIYVRPFPTGEGRTTVSAHGGGQPRWSPDGKELFYAEGGTLIAVSVSTDPMFSVCSATRLFEHPTLTGGGRYPKYDVSADGREFIFAEAEEPSIRVVQNWYASFQDRQQD